MALSVEKQTRIINVLTSSGDWMDSDAIYPVLDESKYKVRTWLAAMLAECTIPGWLVISRQGPRLAEYKAVRDPNMIYSALLKSPVPMTFTEIHWEDGKIV